MVKGVLVNGEKIWWFSLSEIEMRFGGRVDLTNPLHRIKSQNYPKTTPGV